MTTTAGDILPDLLRDDLDLVFCGSAAGHVSARLGAYYAGPGNRFWPTLHAVGLTPERLSPPEFPRLLDYGIGLTDLAKRESGLDRDLSSMADDPDGLRRKIERYRPRLLAFTAKRPACVFLGCPRLEYGLQSMTVGQTQLFVLPSPSGAARGYWSEGPWRDLAERVRSTHG